jgi:hypothetical protein
VDARLQADEAETTQLVLDIVAVAQDNGLRLPREFGLILKQVRKTRSKFAIALFSNLCCIRVVSGMVILSH